MLPRCWTLRRKSTLLKLLVRFYEIDRGHILVGGKDISTMTVEAVRSRVALVMQDTHLFDMTIKDNIRCGRPDAGEDEVVRAAVSAQADEIVCGHALSELMRGRTTIAGAHRLSTVQHADRIFVMDAGTVVDSGMHGELLERCPLYGSLCRYQMIRSS